MQMFKRLLAVLLALSLALSLAACGSPAKQSAQEQGSSGVQQDGSSTTDMDREDKELIAELIGNQENASDLSDKELDAIIEQIISSAGKDHVSSIINLVNDGKSQQIVSNVTENMDREDKELVAELLGGKENTTDMSDEELDKTVDQLIEDLGGDHISGGDENPEDPVIDMDPGAYDEEGAMKEPFDQVYPELIEEELVAFSGESILVKLASGTLTAGLKAAGIGSLELIVPMSGCAWYEAKLVAGTDVKTALAAVRLLDEVLLAEYNYEIQTDALDDYKHFDKEQDEDFKKNGHNKDQWHFHYCGIVDGYNSMETTGGDSSVVVAVIDSGVDFDHEDLIDNMWVNTKEIPDNSIDDDRNGYIDDYYGVDIVSGKGNGDDTNGHGTHVAGIIAARNNNVGVLGIAYNVKIMSVKAAMHNGTLNQADIAKAVLYAYENGAEVINMSFGGTACSIAVQDALATAYTRCVLVASAGNNSKHNEGHMSIPNYPAALTYVLGVMSVDETGRESAFTNWDVIAYNGVEYELYAPGENIMSTLPGNKYGYLSGTSMAAPVVSAFAAILRSEFTDRDKYPTKFIYGQLASTSGIHADCLNPQIHGGHNLPQVANLYAALTVMPKPEVNMQDYKIFDDPKYSAKNNGDGVIDAGETFALGLTLRNRWGMSENTLVTIDTISGASGMSDPYITIQNPTVNYGSVGTYSTQDCGKIMEDGLFVGWENPFLITVSEDCPNDYRFTLNVTVTCENALDEADNNTYTGTGTVDENVRAGSILPQVIDEDMVLTSDKLYIIPNSTIITAGTTVQVEPGTHIQFWSDDRDDPYAEDYIAYLRVEGNFLVNGTKENPVYIYPSELMSNYVVEFGYYGKGVVDLRYADITNYNLAGNVSNVTGITSAFGCVFRQNYGGNMSRRYLSGGVVNTNNYVSSRDFGYMTTVQDSVFYKCGSIYGGAELEGTAIRCLFLDSTFNFSPNSYATTITLQDCVFLGNYLVDQAASNRDIIPTSYTVRSVQGATYSYMGYSPASGSIYVSGASATAELLLREFYDAQYAIFESEEELTAAYESGLNIYDFLDADIRYDEEAQTYLWYDGTPVGDFLLPVQNEGRAKPAIYNGKLYTSYPTSSTKVLEIPGPIVPDSITLPVYEVQMNTQETYQLEPVCTPLQLPNELLVFESSDENIVTVDETGLLTPVGIGTADVYIYSADRAVCNYVTVTVEEYVALESMVLAAPEMNLEIGTTAEVDCLLTPADTTSRNVVWSSSNEAVATVDGNGKVTAVGVGSATITASCSGLSASADVKVWKKTETVSIQNLAATASVADGPAALPEVTVSENSSTLLYWESTDTEVAKIEGGMLVPLRAGTTTVKVTDLRSGLSDHILYYVTEDNMPQVQKIMTTAYNGIYSVHVLYEDGVLYGWREHSTQYGMLTGIRDFTAYRNMTSISIMAIKTNNQIVSLSLSSDGTLSESESTVYNDFLDRDPVKIYSNHMDGCFVQLADGTVYTNTEGNNYGQAGVGYTGDLSTWEKVLIDEPIREISCDNSYTMFLAESGNLYAAGGYETRYTTPTLIARDVTLVDKYNFVSNGILGQFSGGEVTMTEFPWNYDLLTCSTNNVYPYTVRDSVIYYPKTYNEGSEQVVFDGLSGITGLGVYQLNAVPANFYISTADGLLYHLYKDQLKVVALRPIENDYMRLTGSNLKADCLEEDSLSLTFSNVLTDAHVALYENGAQVGTRLEINDNTLTVSNALGFAEGKTYRIVISPEKLVSNSGAVLENAVDLSFTYSSTTATAAELSIGLDLLSFTNRDTFGELPPVVATEGALLDLSWTSSDPAVAEVIGGKLVIHRVGTTSLTVTDRNSGLTASIPVYVTEDGAAEDTLNLIGTNLNYSHLSGDTLELVFDKILFRGDILLTRNGEETEAETVIDGNRLLVRSVEGFEVGALYRLVPSETGFFGIGSESPADGFEINFLYIGTEVKEPIERESQRDESIVRLHEDLQNILTDLQKEKQYNPYFIGNAILNRTGTDTDVTHWFRPIADDISSSVYPLGSNWWGTTNETLIGLQLVDHADYPTYGLINYAPYLTEAPENTFPFITSVKLFNKYGEEVTVVGNEEITFQVKFNRDMDTSIPLQVRFGSAYPYGDYEFEGAYVDARTWEGKYTLNTIIENGYHYFSIANGRSADEDLDFYSDVARFGFEIDTTAAQALIMQGTATETGIELRWTQDDFQTLMGYNVYRSDREDGLYTRLNDVVIPADTMTFFDDTVEPGKIYYYNFTVVQTDLNESIPSGKIVIMSKDTMAPNIYHSPVSGAFTGSNLVLSATITDNLNIAYANLYYRVAGTEEWKTIRMNKLNDTYSAIVPAQYLTVSGLEYYIEAFDGVSCTYKGTAEEPFTIMVQEAISADALGDVDGDGVITNLDALLVLYTINDKYNMTAEEFARADLNGDGELWAAEALRILQYVSGVVGSVKM